MDHIKESTKKTKVELIAMINDLIDQLGQVPAGLNEAEQSLDIHCCIPTESVKRPKVFTSQGVIKDGVTMRLPEQEARKFIDEGLLVEITDDNQQAEIPAPRGQDIQPASGHQPPDNSGSQSDGPERTGPEGEGGAGPASAQHPVSGLSGTMQEESSAQGGGSEGVGEIPTLSGEPPLQSNQSEAPS